VASNYEVNIKLNTRTVNKQLNNLEKRISKLNKLAQGGRANRTVLRNEQEKIRKTGQRLALEQKVLKRKQDQVKVDKQALEIEKRRINLMNKPRGGGGGGGRNTGGTGTGGGSRFSDAASSAIISGAFPLLFGQGPLVGLAGALGGGIGSAVGGQMGGFAGGLLATSIITPIQQFGIETAKLGQALNSVNKDTTPLIESLGLIGTNFEKQVKLIEQLGDKETAFALVREKMTQQIGKDGVDSLSRFGDQAQDLTTSFGVFMLNMRVGIANLIEQSGILSALTRQIETDVAFDRAKREFGTGDEEQDRLFTEFQNAGKVGFKDFFSDEAKAAAIEEKKAALDALTLFIKQKDAKAEVEAINDALNKAAQKQLNSEIALLEKSREMGHLSELEFEIQQKIQELKDRDIEIDEEALANKMRKLDALQKERQLALETAAAFERMSQTIATDISQGIQGMIRGTSTLNDMLNNVLNKLIDAAFNMALFGNPQGSLGGGGLLGSLFSGIGSLFSPTPDPTFGTNIPSGANLKKGSFGISTIKRAAGGPVKGGGQYLVGERGPEMFTPGVSGMITPNHALGGSTTVVVNVDASGTEVQGDEEQGRELGRLISAAVQSELIQQKRPGGILA